MHLPTATQKPPALLDVIVNLAKTKNIVWGGRMRLMCRAVNQSIWASSHGQGCHHTASVALNMRDFSLPTAKQAVISSSKDTKFQILIDA